MYAAGVCLTTDEVPATAPEHEIDSTRSRARSIALQRW